VELGGSPMAEAYALASGLDFYLFMKKYVAMREGIDVRDAHWVSTELLLPCELDGSAPYPRGIGGIGGGTEG
jgi:hypothetical protein